MSSHLSDNLPIVTQLLLCGAFDAPRWRLRRLYKGHTVRCLLCARLPLFRSLSLSLASARVSSLRASRLSRPFFSLRGRTSLLASRSLASRLSSPRASSLPAPLLCSPLAPRHLFSALQSRLVASARYASSPLLSVLSTRSPFQWRRGLLILCASTSANHLFLNASFSARGRPVSAAPAPAALYSSFVSVSHCVTAAPASVTGLARTAADAAVARCFCFCSSRFLYRTRLPFCF